MGTQSAYIAPLPRALRTKKSKVRRDFIVSETSPAAAATQVDHPQWPGQARPGGVTA